MDFLRPVLIGVAISDRARQRGRFICLFLFKAFLSVCHFICTWQALRGKWVCPLLFKCQDINKCRLWSYGLWFLSFFYRWQWSLQWCDDVKAMLLQQASSSPGPSGTASPKLVPSPRPNPSPSFGPRPTGSPCMSDGASSSNSPRLGANSPKLGASPKYGSPRLGGSPRPSRTAVEDEAAVERLQVELKEGWTVHTGRDGRLYYCK